ncbi:MAG: sulfatase-like hydrolase/transferase [Planctomycetota bacterium]
MSTYRMLTVILSLGIAAAVVVAAPKPNIIYILVDDLGVGDLSSYGQTNWQTPRLDRMAREGMKFTNAYSGNTVCAPSRAALLTGNHTGRVYQRGNGAIQFRPDPYDITIATRLKNLGYRTAMIGKSGVACNSSDPNLPNEKGFDHFYGLLSHSAAHRNYPKRVIRNGDFVELPGNFGYTGDTYANSLWVEDALVWIDKQVDTHRDEPFFLHLSLTPPHADLTVPERYMAPFRGRYDEVPHATGGYYHQAEPRAAYAGMVAFTDESVGRVLDRLEERGLAENTVVFFASDNGPHFEGGTDPEVFDSNGPYRGGKRDMTDGGLKTAQIAWWPGTIEPGSTSDLVTAFWDFPPTALDLAGSDVPETMDGISIAPTLTGLGRQREHDYLYWEFYERGGKQAVRMGHWKGIRLNVNFDRNGPIALYDLRTDIAEENDVAVRHPDVVARIELAMAEAHVPSEIFKFERRPVSKSKARGARRINNARDHLLVDRAGWSVIMTSSESSHNGSVGANAIDDSTGTWWHTRWNRERPEHPHRITIDMGARHALQGIRVMARQDRSDNGIVKGLDVYVHDTARLPASPMTTADLAFTKNEQEVLFREIGSGRYLTLVSRSGHAGTPFACFANIEAVIVSE